VYKRREEQGGFATLFFPSHFTVTVSFRTQRGISLDKDLKDISK